MIAKTLAKVISGELPIDKVPQVLRPGIDNMVDFYCYQKACWILEDQDRQIRILRFRTFPDHLRPAIGEWSRKLIESRKENRSKTL